VYFSIWGSHFTASDEIQKMRSPFLSCITAYWVIRRLSSQIHLDCMAGM
jgi:hypothetical protein